MVDGNFHNALRRLRIAAQGRANHENRPYLLTDTSAGGVETMRVYVNDLKQLLEDYDRIDNTLRADENFQRSRNDARGDS